MKSLKRLRLLVFNCEVPGLEQAMRSKWIEY